MKDKLNDFPRDLRVLCGGEKEDKDGNRRFLLSPLDVYDAATEVRKKLELLLNQANSGSNAPVEYIKSLKMQLKIVKEEQSSIENRISDHFDVKPPGSNPKGDDVHRRRVDHGAKAKVEKGIADVQAGRFNRGKRSNALQAVFKAFAYLRKNGRMPSHKELKKLGFTNQEATDAGRWLAIQSDLDGGSLFLPLHKEQRGRPKK